MPEGTSDAAKTLIDTASELAKTGAVLTGNAALVPLIAMFTAVLRETPDLFVDVVKLFYKVEPTPEEESALKAKLKERQNPDALFAPPGVS